MTTVASITLVIAGFLVLASVIQPAAERLHLPYTVLLAIVGVAIGGISSFLLSTPLTSAFDDIVRPVVNLPFNASIFLVVFLFLRVGFVEPFGVPTGSMAPTLIGNHREGPCPRCGARSASAIGRPRATASR